MEVSQRSDINHMENQKGIKFSDGSELTAEDAIFTYEYCTNPDTGCTQTNYYSDIQSVKLWTVTRSR